MSPRTTSTSTKQFVSLLFIAMSGACTAPTQPSMNSVNGPSRETAPPSVCDGNGPTPSYLGSTLDMHVAIERDIASCRGALSTALEAGPFAKLAPRFDEIRKLRCQLEEELYWTDAEHLSRGDGTLRGFTQEACELEILRDEIRFAKGEPRSKLVPRALLSNALGPLPHEPASVRASRFRSAAASAHEVATLPEELTAPQAMKDALDLEKLDRLASSFARSVANTSAPADRPGIEREVYAYFSTF